MTSNDSVAKFVNAIHEMNKVLLKFLSKEDGLILERKCAPMDYGPSRRASNKNDRFHFWDYDSDTKMHVLSLSPDQIVELSVLNETFSPNEFITWDVVKSPWFIKRNWGLFS